jgi:hypothetical protein
MCTAVNVLGLSLEWWPDLASTGHSYNFDCRCFNRAVKLGGT